MRRNLALHAGLLLLGRGLFNLAEGTVNHDVLQIHHVRDDLGAPAAWDHGSLGVSVVLVAVGRIAYRRGRAALHDPPDARDPPPERATGLWSDWCQAACLQVAQVQSEQTQFAHWWSSLQFVQAQTLWLQVSQVHEAQSHVAQVSEQSAHEQVVHSS